jgi:hypothetical protein
MTDSGDIKTRLTMLMQAIRFTMIVLILSAGMAGCSRDGDDAGHKAMEPTDFSSLLAVPAERFEMVDIARMNLLCAEGLPGAELLDTESCLKELDDMAERVRSETERHLYRYRQNPGEYENSEGFFQMVMMGVVLAEDFGVRYNPAKVMNAAQARDGDLLRIQCMALDDGTRRVRVIGSIEIEQTIQ